MGRCCLVVVVLVAGWTWATVRGEAGGGHVITGAVEAREATFVLLDGADVIRLRTADLGEETYRVSTPRDASIRPTVSVTDGDLLTSLRGTGQDGPALVEVVLHEAVRWHLRLERGRQGTAPGPRTAGSAGSSERRRADRAGPPPDRRHPAYRPRGGANQVIVRLAGDAPVQVRAGGGAGTVTVDGTTHSGVAGGTTFTPADWASATERYDIDAAAGVASLTVERSDAGR